MQYAWDFTGNGQYTDATGATPTYATTAQTTPGNHTVSVQVTNILGQTVTESSTVDVIVPTLQASAGGPYTVVAGKSITLSGSATTNETGVLSYAWDFTNNGQFTDATGQTPVFSAASITAPETVPVELEVTDASGQTSIADATVNVVPAIVYVDAKSPGKDNGSDWEDAFTSLTAALSQTAPGQTIRVSAGTYYPTTTSDRTATFNLIDGVTIQGGYDGYGAANPDTRNLDPDVTILSGNIGQSNSNSDDSYHVVTGNDVDSTAVLDDLTIIDGYANGSGAAEESGGGIYLSGASPTIENCFIDDNFASVGGGGVYASNSSAPMITNCHIEYNSASQNGGGICDDDSSPTISDSSINANKIGSVTGDQSGGGAMSNYDGAAPQISSTYFDQNTANAGGAVFNDSSSPAFTDCSFVDNVSNGSGDGGAILNENSSPTLTNCTITANSTKGQGGAIYDANSSAPTITNSILWGDLAGNSLSEITDNGSTASVTYSDVQGGETGTGNINADPKFALSPSAGADGQWGTNDDVLGNLDLLPDSPAIGSGNISAGSNNMGRFVERIKTDRDFDYRGAHSCCCKRESRADSRGDRCANC